MQRLKRWIPNDVRSWELPAGRIWQGIGLGRLGRADLAWDSWSEIDDRSVQPRIAAEKGRILRELGRHDAAEELEAPALQDCDDVVVRAMLAIGLTADAVARNDIPGARERLAVATGLVGSAGSTPAALRQQLRLAWVSIEVAQVCGQQPPLDGLPSMDDGGRIEWPTQYAAGTDFHRSKGLLFAAVATGDVRLIDAAVPLAPPALAWAVHLARHDVFGLDAEDAARAAWHRLVPPPGHEASVAATSVGRRLA